MNLISAAHDSAPRSPKFFLLFLVLLGDLALYPYAGDRGLAPPKRMPA